ncbi:BTAD domain-containing putative transcriptional regulator [Amycolatopsis sp. EV170708-02-1]|uniref:AfsR/SARP family transcriptional regulator n=1 Tax=Amycolatopsis sp. EV170708-02-1 TaxID=2919322 RepID=UPI001F0BCEC7|nr:BTAD domain-containing putative transcriptional regulator [Amycolatopsis sp. EV170708-02-1]UMP06126.1 NB-ARC domain-containing protein [Amycolatopsis sp. EV170708-02-1]
MPRFGVLGPLTIEDPPGRRTTPRGDHQRALLAVLLLNANSSVPVDALVETLWPDTPPKSYSSNLHTYVSRLRARFEGLEIEREPHGYRLVVEPADLDLLSFREAAAAGKAASRAGDPAAAAGHYRRALAEWRGPVLSGLHIPRLDADVARLESERLAAFEDCVDAELSDGRHGELTGELQAMITEHPLRERLAAQLMIALHRAGRQADSLAVHRDLRATLVEELGVEPGAEVRRVHAAVLRGEDPVPSAKATPIFPICQLPPDIADLAGRESEIAKLSGLLGAGTGVPVALITGEPGAGKSTLAVTTAHRLRRSFPDGQLFVPLAGASDPRELSDVLGDLLRALGVTGPAIPDDVEARAAVYRGRLADRRVLVVLDDAANPEQVRALLPGTPGNAVLITSRRRLSGLAGADRLPLAPLSGAEAVTLLARLAGPDRVGAERADAERIAKACGNLPLALRIAGSRLAMRPGLPLGKLAGRLEDEVSRLDELQVSDLQVRGSIALSYQALSPAARRAFRLIGRCRTLDLPAWAVTTLIDDEGADEAIDELVEASLLEATGLDPTGEQRFRVHDLVRVFATELGRELETHAERVATVAKVSDAALCLADTAARRLPRTVPMPLSDHDLPAQPLDGELVERLLRDPGTWFSVERANLVSVVSSLCAVGWRRKALRILERLSAYLYLHSHYTDMRTAYETLRDAAREAGDRHIAVIADANLAVLLHVRGEYERAAEGYRGCSKELATLGDLATRAWVETNLAHCLVGLGRAGESLHAATQAREMSTVEDSGTHARRAESAALHRLGKISEALEIDRRILAQARESADDRQLGVALQGLSWSLMLDGRQEEALATIEESVRVLRRTTARSALAKSLRTQGAILAGAGQRAGAVKAYENARRLAGALEERPRELSCTRAIAASWIGDGRADRAIPVLRRCLDEFRAMGGKPATGLTLHVLRRAYEAVGETRAAEAAGEEAKRLEVPHDANASTLVRLLLSLTEPAPA